MSTTRTSTTSSRIQQPVQEEGKDLESLRQRAEVLWDKTSIASHNFYFFLQDLKEKRLTEQTAAVENIVSMMEIQGCSIEEMAELLEISPDEVRHYLSYSEPEEQEPYELLMFEW